jgi:hypothetical protein
MAQRAASTMKNSSMISIAIYARDVQAIFFRRRRHQPSKPPLAKIRPGLGLRD